MKGVKVMGSKSGKKSRGSGFSNGHVCKSFRLLFL